MQITLSAVVKKTFAIGCVGSAYCGNRVARTIYNRTSAAVVVAAGVVIIVRTIPRVVCPSRVIRARVVGSVPR